MQHEVTKSIRLLDENGHITEPGWSRQPYWIYDRQDIKAQKWRIKEWDYYLIANDSYGVAFTISDLAYIGMISVSLLNFAEKWEHTETILTLFPMGKFHLSSNSDNGNAEYQDKRILLKYETKAGKRFIYCDFKDFMDNQDLKVQLELSQPPMESMCIATPWKEKPTAFYYNQKLNCMPASGYASLGNDTYSFSEHRDFGILDWGRGVWTYDNTWYWGTGSGQIDSIPFGFNLGYGFSDRSSASENVIFYNNKVHKLDHVDFGIPRKEDGTYDFMEPWEITSNDNRLTGIFTPILNRHSNTNALIIVSEQNQVFGYFNGKAILDDNTVLDVRNFFCALEVMHNKY